jgi:thioredoxin-related protein
MNTKGLCKAVALLLVAGTLAVQAGRWEDDFAKAKKEAAEKGLPILMDFTGSDWCIWCKRLDKEVFSTSEFKKYARKNLVLFVADFPRQSQLPKKTSAQNKELAKTYGIRGFPTVVLVDADGKEIARTGYQEGGGDAYVSHLKDLLKSFEAKPQKDDGDKK